MILEDGGRFRSHRTLEEMDEMLRKEIESLSKEERETLELLLSEVDGTTLDLESEAPASPSGNLIKVMSTAEYIRTPVDIRTFVKDPYFLGHTCDNIYPKLLDDLEELFSGDYQEAIFTGSIGYGKTFVASIGVCRLLYEISCLRDPHASFGLARDTNIALVGLSVNEALATKVVFENISTKIRASKYFQEHFPFAATKKELRFPNNVWVAARATTDTSSLGLNVIGGILDEGNFMQQNNAKNAERFGAVDHAEIIYTNLKRRMKSRFERRGKLPGVLFIVSSKNTTNDFTARRIRDSKTDPKIFVRDYALWEVKPDDYFTAKSFHVLVGNEQVPSQIVSDEDAARFRATLPEGTILLKVPEDFRTDFEANLEGAIRDIAGCATVAISPFIQQRGTILDAVKADQEHFNYQPPASRHPFSHEVHDPSRGGTFVWDRMVRYFTERGFQGGEFQRLKPVINPDAPRHIHIDPSLRNDALGFCMAHIGGFKDVLRRHSATNEQYVERAPIYVVDVMLQVVPPPGHEIILGEIRGMVYELSKHGYSITSVTFDQFQSADSIQQLQQKGYNANLLSVDTTLAPYENLKSALYEGRLLMYNYAPVIRELQQLEKDNIRRKVDHPRTGSKDVSDALAGACYTLSQLQIHRPLPILPGVKTQGDAWLPEQYQASAAGLETADMNEDLRVYGKLPPFFMGGNQGGGGGWYPG